MRIARWIGAGSISMWLGCVGPGTETGTAAETAASTGDGASTGAPATATGGDPTAPTTGGPTSGGATTGGDGSSSTSAGTTEGGATTGGEPPRPAIYVSPAGDDADPGTKDAPVRTFAHALELWSAGWEIRALGGVFHEQLAIDLEGTAADPVIVLADDGAAPVIDATGDPAGQPIRLTGRYIEVRGFEVRGSGNQCVRASGQSLTIGDLLVHDCVSHGVQIDGQDVVAEGLTIYDTVLENEGEQGAWGSALKVSVGGAGIVLRGNEVFHNWGEGIAVTRGSDVQVLGNRVYDNYSVNIYVDNAYSVLVEGNWLTCTADSGYERAGKRAAAIALAEEFYDGWGAQLADVTVQNNLAAFCDRGLIYYGADVPGGGLDHVTIRFNTLWGSVDTALSLEAEPTKTMNTEVAYNLVAQPEDKVAVIADPAGIVLHDNFWVGPLPDGWRNCNGPGDLVGDPKLAFTPNYEAQSLRLAADSPARDRAPAAVERDAEGKPRAAPGSPMADLGALEYGDPDAPSPLDAMWP